jgi:hypothetical protein
LGVATARERVVSFLHGELERVTTRDDLEDYADEARPEREGRVAGVVGALQAARLLGADEAEAWRLRLSGLGVERPTPSERTRRAADELLQELLEAVPLDNGGRAGSTERHAGLAMIALAVHEDATSLHFHFVGEPAPVDAPSPHSKRAFDAALEALVPPALRDDRGTAYEPVDPHLVSASSHSHEPDSDPRLVIIGAWLYTPAASDEGTSFEIEQAGGRWTLPATT